MMRIAIILLMIAIVGCSQNRRDPASVARAYAEKERPGITKDMDGSDQRAVVVDRGDRWLVTFKTKFSVAGGGPYVFVRKSDLAVVDRYYTQ
jgi:hypothetical protein